MPRAAHPGVPGAATHSTPPFLLEDTALSQSRSPAEERPRPSSSRRGRGPSLRRTGPHPGVGCGKGTLAGSSVPPLGSCRLFCGDAGLGKLGPLWPCCNLQRARGGVSPPVEAAGPQSPPATPRGHEFLGNGPDRHS